MHTHKYFCFKYNKYICLKEFAFFWRKPIQYENWRIAEKYENLIFYALNYKCLIVGLMIKLQQRQTKTNVNV